MDLFQQTKILEDIEGNLNEQEKNIAENKISISKDKEKLDFEALKAENDSLSYQIKRNEEEIYAKSLQLAGQRQMIESLQEKLSKVSDVPSESPKKNEEAKVWEDKYNESVKKCMVFESMVEEVRKKNKKDSEILEAEIEHSRKNIRKLEDEIFYYRKSHGELEVLEAKVKKEVSEKEKLVKTLEDLTKKNQQLRENLEKSEKRVEELVKISGNSEEKDKVLAEKNVEIQEISEKLWKTEKNLQIVSDTLGTTEKFLENTKVSYSDLLIKFQKLEEICQKLEDKNKILTEEIAKISEELQKKISEIDCLTCEIKRIKEEELISFKVFISAENQDKNEEIFEARKKTLALEQELGKKSREFEEAVVEKNYYKKQADFFENEMKKIEFINKELKTSVASEKSSFEQTVFELKNQCSSMEKYSQDLELKQKKSNENTEKLESKILKLYNIISQKNSEIERLDQDYKSFGVVLSQANSEKSSLETIVKQKDVKIKAMSSKISLIESQIQEKNKEILLKETELINADRQIDVLKKKISSSTSRIKQIASEQLDNQKKKLDNYESEIKMLKEMLKSVQTELKYKQQEILKFKKNSPKGHKKDPLEGSPQVLYKQKIEKEPKMHPEHFKDSPFKKNSVNIFKQHSPFKINSKKNLASDDTPEILKHVIKGYLTSWVLCEKDKKEMMRVLKEEDQGRKGILSKEIVIKKCDDFVADLSLLNNYKEEEVDYGDFVETNHLNQLQQIHRDLELNFSQVLPGSISVSELKLISQSLRPLHKQIWDIIVERINNDYHREVDLYVLKQVLLQTSISL